MGKGFNSPPRPEEMRAVGSLVRVLELNEDRLYAWLVEGSVTVVREDLGRSIEYVKALREMIKVTIVQPPQLL